MHSSSNVFSLEKKFFDFENVIDVHFKLYNIVMLMAENYQSDWYDCYCNKTQFCCCSPRVRNYFLRKKARCGMCKLQTFCTKKNLIDGFCAKAFLERNSENAKNLRRFANKMWPLIKNVFLVRKKKS